MKLRKRSKSKATLDKVDRALQNAYRRWFPKAKCEVCGRPAQVRHHHVEKSKSNFCRYLHENLVALCHSCHSKITFGDHNVVATYSIRRGAKWVERMKLLKRESKEHYSKKELEAFITFYSQEIPPKELQALVKPT